MNLPVLYYIRKVGCPACHSFENQWNKLIHDPYLQDKIRFIEYTYSGKNPIPKPISKYATWFPSIILFNPQSYYSTFTTDGKLLPDYQEYITLGGQQVPKVIKGIKYNAQLNAAGEYSFANLPNTYEDIKHWIATIYNTVYGM